MKSNEEYWTQSPEHEAKLIASEGDYDYEHALRWVMGGLAIQATKEALVPQREVERS